MRLPPIERPPTLTMRLAYWMSRRTLGKVMMPMKVVYARIPKLARVQYGLIKLSESGLSIEPRLKTLIQTHMSVINGCTFCGDLHEAMGLKIGISERDFRQLTNYRTDPAFSPRERAALAAAEEIAKQRSMEDATFDELHRHFNETQIAELVWLSALMNYFNTMAVALEIGSDGFCALPRRSLPEALPVRTAG